MTPAGSLHHLEPFFRAEADGITLTLRVSPKSSRAAIVGAVATPEGWALKVAVTAAPEKGKANAEVTALLAQAFGVAKSRAAVIFGETDRRKVVRVSGEPEMLLTVAQQWMPSQ